MSAIYNTNSPLLDISIQKAEQCFLENNRKNLIRYTDHALKILLESTHQSDCEEVKRNLQMGKMRFFRGEDELAKDSFQKALDIIQKNPSNISGETLGMMTELPFLGKRHFSPSFTQNFLEKGLEIAKMHGHNSILWKFNYCIGLCFEKSEEYETACKYYHYAVLQGESTPNLESRNLAMIYRRAGDCLEKLGYPEEALKFLNKAVDLVKNAVSKKKLTPQGGKLLETLTKPSSPLYCENVKENLVNGELLFKLQQYERSEEFFRLALEAVKKNPSKMSEEVLEMMAHVANDCIKQFSPTLARDFLVNGLEIAKKYGHKSVLWQFNLYLGLLHKQIEEYETAYKYYEEAILQGELHLDLNSPNLALIYNNAGVCLEMMGRYEESLKFANLAFQIRKANFGLKNRETLRSLSNIGTCYFFWEKYSLALEAFEAAVGISRTLYGEDNETTQELVGNIKFSSLELAKEEKDRKAQLDELIQRLVDKSEISMKS